jgi:D-alanine-D-alanine ligase
MRIGFAFDLKTDPSDERQEEFDSPETIAAVAGAIRKNGHTVIELGDGRELVEKLLADPPDLVFTIAEGQGVGRCREARVPAVCEMLSVPYIGSDPLTLAATLDKDVGRRLVASAGVLVPAGGIVHPGQTLPSVPYPAFVKPAWEGSSKGISARSILANADEARRRLETLVQDYGQPVLMEEFIDGHEVTVGLLGPAGAPEVLGVMRILPREPTENFIYDHRVKSDCLENLIYECPAQLPTDMIAEIKQAAVRAYQALGCRDFGRVDFRVRGGKPYFLEANPLPGLNPQTGDIAMIARDTGMSYHAFIGRILEIAIERLQL